MDNIKILYWNCNGIKDKITELTHFIHTYHIDIVLLGETRINPNNKIKINNYHTYRQDNSTPKGKPTSGGTAILVKSNIVHQEIHNPTELNSTSIIVQIGNRPTRISSVYRSHKIILKDSDLDILTNDSEDFLVAGDFNAKHTYWNSSSTNTSGRTIYNHMNANNNYIITAPDTPTHFPYRSTHRPDVLDIALLNIPNKTYTITNFNDLSSDHNPIIISIEDSTTTINPPVPARRINWKKFENEMGIPTKHDRIRSTQDIENQIQALTSDIHKAIDISLFSPTITQQPQPLPQDILLEIHTKRTLRKQWQQSLDPITKRMYYAQTQFVKDLLTSYRQENWDNFTETLKFSDKSIYKLNRRLLRHKKPNTPLLTTTGTKIFDDTGKAELFAESMESQFKNNPGPFIEEVETLLMTIEADKSQNNTFISPEEVTDIIKTLPSAKAPGRDSITNTMLKHLPRTTTITLARIYTACFRHCYFPDAWKTATMIMIPKPGKALTQPENHRPISLLPTMSKILEKLILCKLKKIITPRPEQHAFRAEHSTTTQLVRVIDHIAISNARQFKTAAILLDMEKAFDKVWHPGLIFKLANLNVPIPLIKIIKSFISRRKFYIKLAESSSTLKDIEAGVPQGSCLSPLLYIVYIDDLPTTSGAETSLFADDTMFFATKRSRREAVVAVQRQLDTATKWFDTWRLKLNVQKTKAILFSRKQPERHLMIKGAEIPWTSTIKYLGVTIDKNLNFQAHVKSTVQKAKRVRASLFPILNQQSRIPTKTKISIMKIYIRPILTYAIASWAPFISERNWSRIEAVQNISVRTITNAYYLQSNVSIHRATNTTTIKDIAKTYTRALLHKTEHSKFVHLQQLGRKHLDKPTTRRSYHFASAT